MVRKEINTELLLRFVRGDVTEEECRYVNRRRVQDAEVEEVILLLEAYRNGEVEDWSTIEEAAHNLSDKLFDDFRKSVERPEIPRAITIFDSQFMPPPRGVRPASTNVRDIRLQLGDGTVDLGLYPIGLESCEAIGKLSGLSGTGRFGISAKSESEAQRTVADEHGMFRFERLTSGEYRFEISIDNKVIGVFELTI